MVVLTPCIMCAQVLTGLESLLAQAAAAEQRPSGAATGPGAPACAARCPAAADPRRPLFWWRCEWPPRGLLHALALPAAPAHGGLGPSAQPATGRPGKGGAAAAANAGMPQGGDGGQEVIYSPAVASCVLTASARYALLAGMHKYHVHPHC